jgi:transposase
MHYETNCGNLLKVIWHDGQGACLFTNDLHSYYTSFIVS